MRIHVPPPHLSTAPVNSLSFRSCHAVLGQEGCSICVGSWICLFGLFRGHQCTRVVLRRGRRQINFSIFQRDDLSGLVNGWRAEPHSIQDSIIHGAQFARKVAMEIDNSKRRVVGPRCNRSHYCIEYRIIFFVCFFNPRNSRVREICQDYGRNFAGKLYYAPRKIDVMELSIVEISADPRISSNYEFPVRPLKITFNGKITDLHIANFCIAQRNILDRVCCRNRDDWRGQVFAVRTPQQYRAIKDNLTDTFLRWFVPSANGFAGQINTVEGHLVGRENRECPSLASVSNRRCQEAGPCLVDRVLSPRFALFPPILQIDHNLYRSPDHDEEPDQSREHRGKTNYRTCFEEMGNRAACFLDPLPTAHTRRCGFFNSSFIAVGRHSSTTSKSQSAVHPSYLAADRGAT